MDADTHNLIIELSARAGMIMEDASAETILVPTIPSSDLARHLDRLCTAAENSAQLLRSAQLLVDQ